jgi:hypothetical protein
MNPIIVHSLMQLPYTVMGSDGSLIILDVIYI